MEKKLIQRIKEYPKLLLYNNEIIKQIEMLPSGCSFNLPTANTDWAIEVFRIIEYLCRTFKETYFITNDKGNKPGRIYLYINPQTK